MVLAREIAHAGAVKKILWFAAAVVAAFIVLKVLLALVSAVFGVLLFLGVVALVGFGAYSVMRVVIRGRRNRSLV